MQIPNTIKVGDKKYTVMTVTALPRLQMGNITYAENVIRIADTSGYSGAKYSQDSKRNVFWHELTHAILHDMGHKLKNDEVFVTAFSNRLHASIKSARFA